MDSNENTLRDVIIIKMDKVQKEKKKLKKKVAELEVRVIKYQKWFRWILIYLIIDFIIGFVIGFFEALN